MVPVQRIVKTRTFFLFVILGFVTFVAYLLAGSSTLTFVISGPPIYAASFIRSLLSRFISFAPWMDTWLLLFPITLFYYSFVGFELSALRREKGWFARLSILILVLFLLYIHYKAWTNLTMYYVPRVITG